MAKPEKADVSVNVRLTATEFGMLKAAAATDGHLMPGVEARRMILRAMGVLP